MKRTNTCAAMLCSKPSKQLLSLLGLSAVVLPALSGTANIPAKAHAWHSGMSAAIEHRFKPTGQSLHRSYVYMSEDGYRVDDSKDKPTQSLITNFASSQVWMVNTISQMIHEIPVTEVPLSVDGDTLEKVVRLPGGLDSTACFGQKSRRIDDVVYKQKTLQTWECSSTLAQPDIAADESLPVLQYFSEEIGLVVYSLNGEGLETALIDMQVTPIDIARFSPPSKFSAVSVEQFWGAGLPMGQYDAAGD